MASASSYLFYGVFVTLPSLLIAARARQSPELRALDVISQQRRRGTSETVAGCGAVTKISSELWYLIRADLEDTAWIEAEHELCLSMCRGEWPQWCFYCGEYTEVEECGHYLEWSEVDHQEDVDHKRLMLSIEDLPDGDFENISELLESLHLKLFTGSDTLRIRYQYDLNFLVPLGIRSLAHECAGHEEDVPFAAVSNVSALFDVVSSLGNMNSQREHFRQIVKSLRLQDAREPAPIEGATVGSTAALPTQENKEKYADGFATWYLWTQGHLD